MRGRKIHMENGKNYRYILHKALCGFCACFNSCQRAYITDNPMKVTCKNCLRIMRVNKREYPCPKCKTGELYDDGGMFMAQIKCNNPECNYEWTDYYGIDLITTE